MPLNRQDKQKLCLYKRAMRRQVYELMTTEAKNAFIRTIKADAAYSVISDMNLYLREIIKYRELPDDVRAMVEDIRVELRNTILDKGIDLDSEWS